ncbi:MAG: TlpA disulfide reductase family protein [Marinifilaceae bacterium]
MKKFLFTIVLCLLVCISFAQKTVGNHTVKNLTGKSVKLSKLIEENDKVVISLWATWCKPCVAELTAINEEIEDWQEETGVKFIAISIDDSRSKNRVKSFVRGRAWGFDVYTDENQDFKRAMGVNLVPHTFLLYKGKIVWEHSSYVAGDEQILFEKIKSLNKNYLE